MGASFVTKTAPTSYNISNGKIQTSVPSSNALQSKFFDILL